MRHVCNMHSNFVIAVFQLPEGKRIVKVLCIRRVNSEGQGVSEIHTSLEVFLSYIFRYGVSRIGYR